MGAVDWALAEKVAVRAAGREPFAESYHYSSLAQDFEELTAIAEVQVAEATGLRSLTGDARARVTDRRGCLNRGPSTRRTRRSCRSLRTFRRAA